MSKITETAPEIFRSDMATTDAIKRLVRTNQARKIGPKLYTRNILDDAEAIIRRNIWNVLSLVVPGTTISHRTAFEMRAASDGSVFVTGDYSRTISLPGLIVHQVKGHKPLPVDSPAQDMPFYDTLFMASRPRFILENLSASRDIGRAKKTVGRDEVEARLSEILRASGEDALNKLRDQARGIASILGLEDEQHELNDIVGTLLGTRSAVIAAPTALAYAQGQPYDPNRVTRFNALFSSLRAGSWPSRPDDLQSPVRFQNAAFFDAYFSNYIEGTDFLVEEAMRIVFENEIPADRPEDAHDIMGTYRLVSSLNEMSQLPQSADDFLRLLRHRHGYIMEGRPNKAPGDFKTKGNRAGSTFFVAANLVEGTLRKGYSIYTALDEPFARALFIMFLIAEVHPFVDGNGRLSRVMMNAELIAAGQTRILIPSVYRTEYINSLKLLTNYDNPSAFIRVMDQAQLFTSRIDFSNLNDARATLEACNALHDPADNVKLEMP